LFIGVKQILKILCTTLVVSERMQFPSHIMKATVLSRIAGWRVAKIIFLALDIAIIWINIISQNIRLIIQPNHLNSCEKFPDETLSSFSKNAVLTYLLT